MAKKTTINKVNIRSGAQLKTECQQYLKDAIAEVLLDCQETLSEAKEALNKQKKILKKQNQLVKTLEQQLKKNQTAVDKKPTKAAQNKVKTVNSKLKEATKTAGAINKNITKIDSEIEKINAYYKKQKALKSALSTFEKNYKAELLIAKNTTDANKTENKVVKSKPVKKTVETTTALVDTAIKAGQKAPSFTAMNDQGQTISLNDFTGKKVVLYFYPKDDTPGCTAQAHDFTQHAADFAANNTVIIGVSRDDQASHQRFKEKYNLNFDLLVDSDEVLCEDYGVIKMKNMYGKQVRGIERSTFLIDEMGVISQVWRKVKVADHVKTVLSATQEKEFTLA